MNTVIWQSSGSSALAAGSKERTYRVGLPVAAALSVLVAVMARTVIDHAPQYDELLHFLAAQGLIARGQPVIADGQYSRAALFTRLVAWSMSLFGQTPVAARFPAVAGAALVVFCTSLFATRQAGWIAGLAAGLTLCAVPFTIDLAVFCRFYTLHAALVALAGMAVYGAIAPRLPRSRRVALIVAALAALAIAFHLQPTTAIAAGALMAAITVTLALDHWPTVRAFAATRLHWIAIAIAVLLTLGILAVWMTGLAHELRSAPLWARDSASRIHFYLAEFAQRMPLLWPLSPLAAICAVRGYPRLTTFCAVVFVSALLVHSLAAAKAARYVYYCMPFLAIIWGCAVSSALAEARLAPARAGRSPAFSRANIAIGIAALTLAFSVEGQQLVKLALGRATPAKALAYGGEADWRPAVASLRPLLSEADRVVTSNAMKAIYYFGRYDYELNASIVLETDTRAEFGEDRRTGRRAIGTPQSIAKLLDMAGTTLIVMEEKSIGVPSDASVATMLVITQRCALVALPLRSPVIAWTCRQPAMPAGSSGAPS